MGPNATLNQFDQTVSDQQQHDAALQDPDMINFPTTISRALSSRPQFYTGRDGLQAYLIRQQLCAGIPVDKIVPMSGPGSRQMRPPHYEVQTGGGGPAMINLNEFGAFVPAIPPAEFNGVLHPLPIHPWFPYPNDYYHAQVMDGPIETGASNTSNGQSQNTTTANDRDQQPDLAAPPANGDDATDNPGDTEVQQSVGNTDPVNNTHVLGPVNNYWDYSASSMVPQFDGVVNMMEPSLAPGPSGFPVNSMTSMLNNNSSFNTPPMLDTHTHFNNAQFMTGNSAHFGNCQPMIGNDPSNHYHNSSMNGYSNNGEYGQLMAGNIQANGYQGPSHVIDGSNPSLLTPSNQSIASPVSQGFFPSVTNTTNIPFQTFGTNENGANGISLTNGAMAFNEAYQPMLSNNQIDTAQSANGTPDGSFLSDDAQSLLDIFHEICPHPISNGSSTQANTVNDLASFFDSEEDQQIITDFYTNYFRADMP